MRQLSKSHFQVTHCKVLREVRTRTVQIISFLSCWLIPWYEAKFSDHIVLLISAARDMESSNISRLWQQITETDTHRNYLQQLHFCLQSWNPAWALPPHSPVQGQPCPACALFIFRAWNLTCIKSKPKFSPLSLGFRAFLISTDAVDEERSLFTTKWLVWEKQLNL